MKITIVFFLIILVAKTKLEARAVRMWSYAELTAAADVVVIGRPLSNVDTKDLFQGQERGYIGVSTEFQAEDIIKGDVRAEKFTVLHFKLAPNKPMVDGMLIVTFRLEGFKVEGVQMNSPRYLLFLKKDSDGRYEPVTGQMDAVFSVKEVNNPF